MATSAKKRYKYLGQRAPKVDSTEKVTGEAIFGADLRLPNMAYGKILRSPHAHARIESIDTAQAEKSPGVLAVITGEDFPMLPNGTLAHIGNRVVDMTSVSHVVMAREKVHFHGQPVAAVAASSLQDAENALRLISVRYQPLPAVLEPDEAMKEDAPLLHPDMFTQTNAGALSSAPSNVAQYIEFKKGDVSRGLDEADAVVELFFKTHMVHHCYIEPESETAMVSSDGKVTVWAPTQGTFLHREELAVLMQMPPGKITVVPLEVGGGFGGKEHIRISPLCVALSKKCGRPVQITLTREEVLRATGPGAASRSRVRIGAKANGTISALDAEFVYSGGCYPGAPIQRALWAAAAPYQPLSFLIRGYDVVTNKPKTVPYRAPGGAAATFAIESAMDHLAQQLDIDPLELRRINLSQEGDQLANRAPFGSIGFADVLRRVEKHPAWTESLPGPNQGRGLALGYWPSGSGQASCYATLNGDGSVNLVVGSVDLSSTRTGLAQIVAEELDIALDEISVTTGDTRNVGHTDASAGSRISHDMGTAVYYACQDMLSQLKHRAAEKLHTTPAKVEYSQGAFWKSGEATTVVLLEDIAAQSIRGEGAIVGNGFVSELELAPATAAHVVDVEIDPDTGRAKVLRHTGFQDVGFALNPTMVEGQMQGGATQGIGWALTEEYVYGPDGKMENPTLLDYRLPTALDVPMLDCEIIEVPASAGPYGVRGAGEMGIVLPPAAIANAIYRASGVRPTELPMTPERVFWATRKEKSSGLSS